MKDLDVASEALFLGMRLWFDGTLSKNHNKFKRCSRCHSRVKMPKRRRLTTVHPVLVVTQHNFIRGSIEDTTVVTMFVRIGF